MKVIGVITTKNRVDLFNKALYSMLNQNEKVDEIIIVSDSIDENYAKEKTILENVDCVFLKDLRTHNYAGNLNTVIDYILKTHEKLDDLYLAFLDDDDTWRKDYILKSKAALNGEDFVMSGLLGHSELGIRELGIPDSFSINDFLKGNPGIQGSNTFIKLETLLRAGCFDESMSSTTDRDLFTRVMRLNPTYKIINEYLVDVDCNNNRARITNTSNIKKDGLAKFYYKNHQDMSKEVEDAFFKRAIERFDMEKSDLLSRLKTIEEQKEQDKLYIKKYDYLCPNLFSNINDFKYFINSYFEKENSKEFINLVHDSIIEFYSGEDIYAVINDALLAMEYLIRDNKNTRVALYNMYKPIRDELYAVFVKKEYLIDGECNHYIKEYLNHDEAIIKGIIDYVRHAIRSEDTKRSFINWSTYIQNILGFKTITILGYGSEGLVFKGDDYIYKWFKTYDDNLIKHLKFIKNRIGTCPYIYDFEILKIRDFLFIKYPYVQSRSLDQYDEINMENLIDSFKLHGLCLTNIKPSNFVMDDECLKYIDYGYSIKQFNEEDYQRSLIRGKQLQENLNVSELMFYKLVNESYIKGECK